MICLTFDTDWMTQETLARFLAEYPIPGKATIFVHADFPDLENTQHEICPHPFIDNLATWQDALKKVTRNLRGSPKGVRPHSCVFSHMVGIDLGLIGYRYVSQAHAMFETDLVPFRHPWGIWELPIYYMDNMDFWMAKNWPQDKHIPFSRSVIDNAINGESLFVFDFHPLHIALNTRNHEDYGSVKNKIASDGVSPFDLRFPGNGVQEFFKELCLQMSRANQRSYTCSEALAHFGCS